MEAVVFLILAVDLVLLEALVDDFLIFVIPGIS